MNAPQRTAEWFAERAGHATASKFADVMAKIKKGEAASRSNYRIQLVTERLTGLPTESYSNAAMEWGTMQEPHAREAYEAHQGVMVREVGFIKHPDGWLAGASPDGFVGEGLIEIKCPSSTTHVETILAGTMPTKYTAQVQGQMWITGRPWVDFVSFDPRMPEHLQLFVVRVVRDEAYIDTLASAVAVFLAECDALETKLRTQ